MVCDYCHMTRHLKNICYCIHGYPSWHKLFGKPKPQPRFIKEKGSLIANVTTSDAGIFSDGDSVSSGMQSGFTDNVQLSEGQCRQLIQMLQKNMSDIKPLISSNACGNWTPHHYINIVHMSGITGHFVRQVYNVALCQSHRCYRSCYTIPSPVTQCTNLHCNYITFKQSYFTYYSCWTVNSELSSHINECVMRSHIYL